MAATDPAGAQKFWYEGGTFDTLKRTGYDAGSQKWWRISAATPANSYTLAGLFPTTAPPVGTYNFPALTVAG